MNKETAIAIMFAVKTMLTETGIRHSAETGIAVCKMSLDAFTN